MTTDRAGLVAAAARDILDTGRSLPLEQRDAATALLADLYVAGLRHGIRPQDWSAIAGLGHDCIDAIKQRALHLQQAQRRQSIGLSRHLQSGARQAARGDRGRVERELW